MDDQKLELARQQMTEGFHSQIVDSFRGKITSFAEGHLLAEACVHLASFNQLNQVLDELRSLVEGPEDLVYLTYFQAHLMINKNAYPEASKLFFDVIHRPSSPLLLVCKAYYYLGRIYWSYSNLGSLSELLTDLYFHRDNKNHFDPPEEFYYLGLALISHLASQEWTQGLTICQELETLARQVNNRYWQGIAHFYTGFIFTNLGSYQESGTSYLTALSLFDEVGNNYEEYRTLNHIIAICHLQGRLREALELQKRALNLEKTFDAKKLKKHFRALLATYYYEIGNYQLAADYQEEVVEAILEENRLTNRQPIAVAASIVGLARILHKQGRLDPKLPVLEIFPTDNSPEVLGYRHMINAYLAQGKRNYGIAEEEWEKALMSGAISDHGQQLCTEALVELAYKHWRAEGGDENLSILEGRLKYWESHSRSYNLIPGLCKVLILRGKLALSQLNFNKAEEFLKSCINLSAESGLQLHRKLALRELKSLYSQQSLLESSFADNSENTEKNQIFEFGAYLEDLSRFLNEDST